MKEKYDSTNVKDHFGDTYLTETGGRYGIGPTRGTIRVASQEGGIVTGRVKLLAGLSKQVWPLFSDAMRNYNPSAFADLMQEYGTPIKPGKGIVGMLETGQPFILGVVEEIKNPRKL